MTIRRMKKLYRIALSAILIAVSVCMVNIIGEYRAQEQERQYRIYLEYNMKYCKDLCIGGQTACCGMDEIIVLNPKINERELQVRVAYYNIVHDEQITVDEVIRGYEAFVAGKEEGTEALKNYSASRASGESRNLTGTDIKVDESEFQAAVRGYLHGEIGDASEEELEGAIAYFTEHPEEVNNYKQWGSGSK